MMAVPLTLISWRLSCAKTGAANRGNNRNNNNDFFMLRSTSSQRRIRLAAAKNGMAPQKPRLLEIANIAGMSTWSLYLPQAISTAQEGDRERGPTGARIEMRRDDRGPRLGL